MGKRAIIVVRLVPEANGVANEQIKKEILEESSIPWCGEIEKISIGEVENPYKELIEHRFLKKVARNIVRFYQWDSGCMP